MATDPFQNGQSIADLTAFHEIARALTSSLDLESVLGTIMQQIERFFRPEGWSLLLADEQRKDLHCLIANRSIVQRPNDLRVPFGQGIAGEVAERGEPVILPDAKAGSFPAMFFDIHPDLEIGSVVCIPLRSRLRTLGVIQLVNLPSSAFSEASISTLMVLADFAAMAVENARALHSVQELTITDECTGLYNLRHFDHTLPHELARCKRFSAPMSLIFIDLDHFKLINDEFGHLVGNHLLADVSATIKSQVRNIDLCFRYGGDEFIVLLPGTNRRAAGAVGNRLLFALRKTIYSIPPALTLRVRASMGISSYPEDGVTGEELIGAADARMYQIKETTRDGVCFAGESVSVRRRA